MTFSKISKPQKHTKNMHKIYISNFFYNFCKKTTNEEKYTIAKVKHIKKYDSKNI